MTAVIARPRTVLEVLGWGVLYVLGAEQSLELIDAGLKVVDVADWQSVSHSGLGESGGSGASSGSPDN